MIEHLENPQLKLVRNSITPDGVFGQWVDMTSGTHIAHTLEHAFQQPDGSYAPLLPEGDYTIIWGVHELKTGGPFNTYCFPPFTGADGNLHTNVLAAHLGNLNRDSEGCVLVGDYDGTIDGAPAVLASKNAMARFIGAAGGHQCLLVTVQDVLEAPAEAPADVPAVEPETTA